MMPPTSFADTSSTEEPAPKRSRNVKQLTIQSAGWQLSQYNEHYRGAVEIQVPQCMPCTATTPGTAPTPGTAASMVHVTCPPATTPVLTPTVEYQSPVTEITPCISTGISTEGVKQCASAERVHVKAEHLDLES